MIKRERDKSRKLEALSTSLGREGILEVEEVAPEAKCEAGCV